MQEIELYEWQRIDPENGLIECWLTHPSLDFIKSLDLREKDVLMYGCGYGDAWLTKRCKRLISIERNPQWASEVDKLVYKYGDYDKYLLIQRPCNDADGMDEFYCEFPKEMQEPDVIIVDDAYRYECIVKAIAYAEQSQKTSVILIVDNWQQDYVFICPAAEDALRPYHSSVFPQPNHTNHEGRKWQTAVFNLKKYVEQTKHSI